MKRILGIACTFYLACLLGTTPALANQDREFRQHHHESFDVYKYPNAYMRDILLASGDDQGALKKRKEYYRSLPEEEKKKIRKAHKAYEGLSDEEKKKLRKRWEKKSDSEKSRYKKWQKRKE